MLLILCLVVNRQLTFRIFNVLPGKPTLVLRTRNFVANPLNFEFFLAELLAGIHNVAIRRVGLLTKVYVLSLEVFKFSLEHLLITRLLFDLLFVILTQITDTILHHIFS